MISARAWTLILVVALALSWPLLPPFTVVVVSYIGLSALVAVGLCLLTGVGGMISFGQAAFVGIGAYATAWLCTAPLAADWLGPLASGPWVPWLGLLLALVLAFLLAWGLGSITVKLSGHFLPLSTIAWGLSLYYLVGNMAFLGGQTGITAIPPLVVAGYSFADPRALGVVIWAVLLGVIGLLYNLLDSNAGRAIRALKKGRLMAESMGVNTARERVKLFVLAAVLAAISGWLYAHMQRFVNPTPFSLDASIQYLFMSVVGGAGYLWGAVVGSALITVLKEELQDLLPWLLGTSGNFEVIVFGLLMLLVLQRFDDGLWPALQRWSARFVKPTPRQSSPALVAPQPALELPQPALELPQSVLASPQSVLALPQSGLLSPQPGLLSPQPGLASPHSGLSPSALPRSSALPQAALPPAARTSSGAVLLQATGVSRRFGGLIANDAITLNVKAGEIHAVIGPNGAGKSTFFNLISGVDSPTEGLVSLLGRPMQGQPARAFAALGLARTFQHVRLLGQSSVLDNVALGAYLRGRSGWWTSMLHLERRREAALRSEAWAQIERCGLRAHAHHRADALALGQQRVVEIARALAARPMLLLLDEPAAGLRHLEKRALAALLDSLRSEGLGIVVVEHDMEFVMNLADRVTVLDFGAVIAAGTPAQVQADPRVLDAYLGGAEDQALAAAA